MALYSEYWKHLIDRELWRYTANTGNTGKTKNCGVIHQILETLERKRTVALYSEYS